MIFFAKKVIFAFFCGENKKNRFLLKCLRICIIKKKHYLCTAFLVRKDFESVMGN